MNTELRQRWQMAMHMMAASNVGAFSRDEAELGLDRYFAAMDRMLIAVNPRIHAPR